MSDDSTFAFGIGRPPRFDAIAQVARAAPPAAPPADRTAPPAASNSITPDRIRRLLTSPRPSAPDNTPAPTKEAP